MTDSANSAPDIFIITIDGPTASGKGTIAQLVAQKLGFHYLDSGALYRLTALEILNRKVSVDDEKAIADIARNLPCHFENNRIFLAEKDVTDKIRMEEIGNTASRIAALPDVRKALLALQTSFKRPPGLVGDGRDMGTVVFPEAQLKVFLTATAEIRAERRYKQLIEKGLSANIFDLLADLVERDQRDAQRSIAPLIPANDAITLDTSNLDISDVVNQIMEWHTAKRK